MRTLVQKQWLFGVKIVIFALVRSTLYIGTKVSMLDLFVKTFLSHNDPNYHILVDCSDSTPKIKSKTSLPSYTNYSLKSTVRDAS